MEKSGKRCVALLFVLLATSEAFQGAQRRSLPSPLLSSFERNKFKIAFVKLPASHPRYLLYDSKYSASRRYLRPFDFQQTLNIIQPKLTSMFRKVKESLTPIWKKLFAACLALAIMFAPLQMAGAAPSSGRAGGSFKSASHRTSISTPYRSSGTWNYSRQPHGTLLGSPRFIVHGATGWHYGSAGAVAARRTTTIAEMTVLVTVIAILIQGVINNSKRDMMTGPLGAGATMVTLTIAMNVPDRRDPNSIMKRLRKLSLAADTSNRKGVQDLISEGKLLYESVTASKYLLNFLHQCRLSYFARKKVLYRLPQRQSISTIQSLPSGNFAHSPFEAGASLTAKLVSLFFLNALSASRKHHTCVLFLACLPHR